MADLAGTLSYAMQYIGIGSSDYPTVPVKSTVDGQTYSVRDMPDKQNAADIMARVRMKMNKLKLHVEEGFPD
jgi:hypothetical protein